MVIDRKKIELLAPAGSLAKMKTAFAFGADAVYLGVSSFSLRVRINKFTTSDIEKAINYAHKINKKVYITINIFAHNKHIEKLPDYIKKLKKLSPDGLIVSDPGILKSIKKIWEKIEIHLSTQANCINWQSAKFWHEQGIERIILGREVKINEIKEIYKKNPKLELECFVHGAMCMSYSGRCFLSKFFTDRSANLGDCVQPCRWKYEIKASGHDEILKLSEDNSGSYILNSKDLCLIKRIDELKKAGIKSFKIEGRAKSVYYLANIVGAYRRIINFESHNKIKIKKESEFLYNELKNKLFNRGYTEGFMFNNGKLAQNLANSHNTPEWEFCGQVINKLKAYKIKSYKFVMVMKIHNSVKLGDEIEILMPSYDIIKMNIKRMLNAKTGKKMDIAHGGGSKDVVLLKVDREIPMHSVIRRKIN